MPQYDYDLFVIGAGSGGVRAARMAAMAGARVAVAEEDRVGGTCVIRGCVPKKFMVYASEFSHLFKLAEGYGWSPAESGFDWKRFLTTKDVEIARLSGIYTTNLMKAGADLVHAKAVFKDASHPGPGRKGPDGDGGQGAHRHRRPAGDPCGAGGRRARHHLQRSLPSASSCPSVSSIVGGGYIAVEFAGIFNGLGVDTTLVYRGPNILRGFDEDVRVHLSDEIIKRGVKVVLGSTHETHRKDRRWCCSAT